MSSANELAFLSGGGSSLATLIKAHDWSASPLGPPQAWPQSLRSVVGLMLGSAFPMFIGWGPELHTVYNDAYAEIMGDKHPDGLGKPFLDIWHEIRADLAPLVQRAMGGEAFYMENLPLRLRRRGYFEDTWFTFSWSPVLDESGAVAGMHCACTETTRMVLAERHLRLERERFVTMFEQAPGFIAVVRGPDHVFDTFNAAYLQLVGFRDLRGKPLAMALPEVVEQGFGQLLDDVLKTGQPYNGRSVQVVLNRTPGAPPVHAYVDFVFQPLAGPSGEVEGIFIQGHEVTEQHDAQHALREADRKKDEFLATLAHELRNPLAPLSTAAQLLSLPSTSEPARQRAAQIVGRQVKHMAHLLDDLMDIARITQGRLSLRKALVPVGTIVEAAVEAARPWADAKQHTLVVNVADAQMQVFADAVRLTQVLTNLLNNSAKYTEAGGRVVLDVSADEATVGFTVSDNGMGISESGLQTLFAMFAQEKAALERSQGGLGIGLALVKGLVELHGGSVTASSRGVGKGSSFEVRLPRDLNRAEPVPPRAGGGETPGLRGRKVVLADDNADACEVLAALLRVNGHVVHTAGDGIEATELALRVQPDVLVLDIGMPGANGYDVARRIRREPWGQKAFVVAATGWGQEGDRQKAVSAGFDAHLTKPFDPQVLIDLIAQARA